MSIDTQTCPICHHTTNFTRHCLFCWNSHVYHKTSHHNTCIGPLVQRDSITKGTLVWTPLATSNNRVRRWETICKIEFYQTPFGHHRNENVPVPIHISMLEGTLQDQYHSYANDRQTWQLRFTAAIWLWDWGILQVSSGEIFCRLSLLTE